MVAMAKILYLVTEDWFFCQHFLPMARAARLAGCEVVVATRLRAHRLPIEAEGFRTIALESERGSLAPLEALRTLGRATRIVAAERPDIVHCVALRMVVLGGIAAKLAGAKRLVLALTGLGHLWIENGLMERAARTMARQVVGKSLKGAQTHYLFENPDDPGEFGLDVGDPNVTIVGGAGVRPADFPMLPEPPAPPVKIAIVARMLEPKGIAEAVAAVRKARAAGADVEIDLFGAPDPSNRRSLSAAQLRAWSADPWIRWQGPSTDIAGVWRDHHVAMLLSHREGLPRSLVEAAAAGRPIITTDVPGCREVVRHGVEGLLVPRGDVTAAANSVARLAQDASLRARMGAAGNFRARERFSEDAVMRSLAALYTAMLADR
jgi:glycosyltransferase involved in cell wall biosynthesis